MKHLFIRLFGVICVGVGLWLMYGVILAFGEMLSHANTPKEVSGVMAMPAGSLLLIVFGTVAIWRPSWVEKA